MPGSVSLRQATRLHNATQLSKLPLKRGEQVHSRYGLHTLVVARNPTTLCHSGSLTGFWGRRQGSVPGRWKRTVNTAMEKILLRRLRFFPTSYIIPAKVHAQLSWQPGTTGPSETEVTNKHSRSIHHSWKQWTRLRLSSAMAPSWFIITYRCFGWACCLHLQGGKRMTLLERRKLISNQHGVINPWRLEQRLWKPQITHWKRLCLSISHVTSQKIILTGKLSAQHHEKFSLKVWCPESSACVKGIKEGKGDTLTPPSPQKLYCVYNSISLPWKVQIV
jgi:hypothetical protein